LEANDIAIKETVPASRKLQAADAAELLKSASKLVVAKGKKISEFKLSQGSTDEAVAAMLGPTGNLRAPTARVGKNILVGFNDDAYTGVLG
jgi:arsenate reductase-like glutaredoxin family protein